MSSLFDAPFFVLSLSELSPLTIRVGIDKTALFRKGQGLTSVINLEKMF
jgi:hypothetical protein